MKTSTISFYSTIKGFAVAVSGLVVVDDDDVAAADDDDNDNDDDDDDDDFVVIIYEIPRLTLTSLTPNLITEKLASSGPIMSLRSIGPTLKGSVSEAHKPVNNTAKA
ncbi:endonuclease-reverse transcriptase [Plakobranchus ocellatus]|uniref:Endonuclease-reverse transcriptase n=1 Tax=Plakobranchus ocellatus TaxID=259542 RepID=A0AAV4CNH2_9GAST|nr:endonuclease-reverse transcriptase [Plakobranchus ocellatus]